MAVWTLNGEKLADAVVESLAINIRVMATSQMSFATGDAFDAAPRLAFGAPALLRKDGITVFAGTVDSVNRVATPRNESHDFYVVDAWQQLEDTIYQEAWAVGNIEGGVLFPMAILGLDEDGERIDVGEQIEAVIAYAASQGVAIQAGAIASGDILWPAQVENVSCAEVIRTSLKFYPNYVPWIDYSTTPPTLHVTPLESMSPAPVDVSGAGNATLLAVQRMDHLRPASVRVIYKTAQNIDGEIYRDAVIDKFPSGGPDGGPRVLTANIELAGGQMQFQKSQVQVREIPDEADDAVAYLKAKFPHLSILPDAAITVTSWKKTLVPEPDEEHAPPVNPNAERIHGDDVDDLPNELVRGNIAEWMRRKVGRVHIAFGVSFATVGTPNEEQLAAMARPLPTGMTVVATNATTKIYHGLSQWEKGEEAPTGLAQAVYQSMTAAYQWAGSVSIAENEAGGTRYHGRVIRLVNSADAGLETMDAQIHAVDIDVATGRTRVGFGPAPYLSPADFLELQRQIRGRVPVWWSKKERTSNRLGVDLKPGSKGDTVTPYDVPETVLDAVPSVQAAGAFFRLFDKEGSQMLQGGQVLAGEVLAGKGSMDDYEVLKDGALPPSVSENDRLWLKVTVEAILDDDSDIMISGLKLTDCEFGDGATLPATTWPTEAAAGTIYIELGRWPSTSAFLPGGSGNFNLRGCNGNVSIERY